MVHRAILAVALAAMAVALAGCGRDERTEVAPAADREAFSAGSDFVLALRRGAAADACSRLTLEAQIELAAWVQHRDRLRARPPCARALASPAFRDRCRHLWTSNRVGLVLYRSYDVGKPDSKPDSAWWVAVRGRKAMRPAGDPRRLIGACELRLIREGSDDPVWRVDAIGLQKVQSVVPEQNNRLVYRNGMPVSTAGL